MATLQASLSEKKSFSFRLLFFHTINLWEVYRLLYLILSYFRRRVLFVAVVIVFPDLVVIRGCLVVIHGLVVVIRLFVIRPASFSFLGHDLLLFDIIHVFQSFQDVER